MEFKIGAGRTKITPDSSIWMGGYAARTKPSESVLHDLWAKSLVIEETQGEKTVLITADLLAVPREISSTTCQLIASRFGVPRERILIAASHTHSGPVVRPTLFDMYGLDETQRARIDAYSDTLPELLCESVARAMAAVEPACLEWTRDVATFAINRRETRVDGIAIGLNPAGPVEHEVPVLAARRESGSLIAVVFGYACHNTTLSGSEICGDYAGFAQIALEQSLGVPALFVAGCAGDQNPHPRREIDHARQHGLELARAVVRALEARAIPVHGSVRASYADVPVALSPAPSRAELERQLQDENKYIRGRASRLIDTIERDGALPNACPVPIQTWRFGDALQIIAIGGEPVVDYVHALKRKHGPERTFVIGYANDVPAYIPSLRILREGGYEGDISMIYYGLHGPWAESIEDQVLGAIEEQMNPNKAVERD